MKTHGLVEEMGQVVALVDVVALTKTNFDLTMKDRGIGWWRDHCPTGGSFNCW